MDASITACAEYEGLDVNGDGVIDADEIAAWSQQTVAQMCDQFETFEMSCIDYLSWDLDENLDTGSDTLDNCYAVLAGSSSCTDEVVPPFSLPPPPHICFGHWREQPIPATRIYF